MLATALAHRRRGPGAPPTGGDSCLPPAIRVAAARAAAEKAEAEEGVDPSSLPRLLAGADAQSAVHAVLRAMVKERGNLTFPSQEAPKSVRVHQAVRVATR